MKRRFGVEFKETDTGFKVEFSGDEEMVQARKEAIAAWKDFVTKAKKAGLPGFRHHHHFFMDRQESGEGQETKE